MSQDDSDIWLKIDHVMFARERKTIFSDFSLKCAERRIGVLGNNGAGKSTLLRLLNGLLTPQRGAIHVLGVDVPKDVRKAMQTVGFVFQNTDHQIIFPTVIDEVSFGFRNRGLPRADSDKIAREWLVKNGCCHWLDLSVEELSEGQRQKLCLLTVFALEPAVVALDEPFASLDLENRLELADLLYEFPQRLVIASHDLDLLRRMERVIWLQDGAIVGDGRPDDVIQRYIASCYEKKSTRSFH
jgi:biotin transport system ATP-binding protein